MAKPKTKTVRKLDKVVDRVEELADTYAAMTDEELAGTTARLRGRLADGAALSDVRPDAFAAAREAARRALGLTPYRVQVYAGVVLSDGAVAEMRTGEGKTLTATMPVYLHALAGPVDVVTANPYLAQRDAAWMGRVYALLGLTCTSVVAGMSRPAKQDAYRCDVVYSTANELGFDYLRDRLATARDQQVATARGRGYVLIDECDQVLIDEARTPLIISGLASPPSDLLRSVDQVVGTLAAGRVDPDTGDETGDFVADRAEQTIHLTEQGQAAVERALDLDDLYATPEVAYRVHAALEAHGLMAADREYVVDGGQVLIVDEATGRTMPGRRFGKGLHEALEAKHGLQLRPEVRTQATITVQNFFKLYATLAGMTGTAAESSLEFTRIYDAVVHVIPTHRPIARDDRPDVMFLSKAAKLTAAVAEVGARQQAGQPVLVGAATVDAAEDLSARLDDAGIDHELLTARNHAREADIIAQAGRPGAVTVATNMAGRGTDILLGGDPDRQAAAAIGEAAAPFRAAFERAWGTDGVAPPADTAFVPAAQQDAIRAEVAEAVAADRDRVVAAGGLFVLGTERHSSRRVDNQLRGRSGRQGEPGESVFYLSLEDDLLSLFSDTPLQWAVTKLSERGDKGALDELDADDPTATIKALPGADMPIHHPMMGKAVVGAQKRIEEMHFQARENVKKFDDVVADQRTAVYDRRELLLSADAPALADIAAGRVADAVDGLVDTHLPAHLAADEWDLDGLSEACQRLGLDVGPLVDAVRSGTLTDRKTVVGRIGTAASARLASRADHVGPAAWAAVVRTVLLKVLDRHWVELIGDLDAIKDAIGWRSMAQQDPAVEFRREASWRFESFAATVREDQAAALLTANITVTGNGAG